MHLPVASRQRVPQALAIDVQWVTLRNVIELAEDSYRLRLALTFRARLLRHTAR